MEGLKQQRTTAKSRFTRTVNILLTKLDDDQVSDDLLITSILNDVINAWQKVNEKHDAYISELLASGESSETEDS